MIVGEVLVVIMDIKEDDHAHAMFLGFDEVAAQVILIDLAGGGGDEEEALVV